MRDMQWLGSWEFLSLRWIAESFSVPAFVRRMVAARIDTIPDLLTDYFWFLTELRDNQIRRVGLGPRVRHQLKAGRVGRGPRYERILVRTTCIAFGVATCSVQ